MDIHSSVFDRLSLDRDVVKWEDYLLVPTPVELIDGIYFKREDKFAPLGYGGVNGSKLRQCIYLVNNYVNKAPKAAGVISGASVKSPQLAASTVVARHYGLPTVLVIGATNPKAALKHENVAVAARMGARFEIIKVGYNPALQSKVVSMTREPPYSEYYHLEYAISMSSERHSLEEIEEFHRIGANQVKGLPSEIMTLVIPAGSCNTTCSILYGLALHPPPNLRYVYLIGVGPSKIDFVEERLGQIEKVTGLEIRSLFRRVFFHHPEKAEQYNDGNSEAAPYLMYHYDLHSSKFTTYQEEIPWSHGGLEMHPTYEGKVMKYLSKYIPSILSSRTCIWNVGSKPTRKAMEEFLPSSEDPLKEVVLV